MAEANVIRRSSTVEISEQAAKGRKIYKIKIWTLRIFGFICLFFPEPISSIIGLAIIIHTLVKKDKTKLKYKVMAIWGTARHFNTRLFKKKITSAFPLFTRVTSFYKLSFFGILKKAA